MQYLMMRGLWRLEVYRERMSIRMAESVGKRRRAADFQGGRDLHLLRRPSRREGVLSYVQLV
jgi:hypothetical protein